MSSIREFLNSIDLGQYADVFEASDITLEICPTLSDQDLKEIGVASLGHRRKLLSVFATFRNNHQSQPASDCPEWVDSIPTILAVGVDEYYREHDPVLRLWHICDIAELTLRLLTITGLSELRFREEKEGKSILNDVLAHVKHRIELPTLGKWQSIALAVAAKLDSGSPSAQLAALIQRELIPLLDGHPGEGNEWSLRQLRNQLAHGGGITKARARALFERWKTRIEAFLNALKSTQQMKLIVRIPGGHAMLRGTSANIKSWIPADESERLRVENAFRHEGDVVLADREACFGLWPLSLFTVPYDDGKAAGSAAPQVYVRRGEVGLVYTPIGSSEASQHTAGDETAAAFEKLLRSDPVKENTSGAGFKITGFESLMEREAQNLVGRLSELEIIEKWIASENGRLGLLLGGAGTGKSLLMARISTDLMDLQNRHEEKHVILVYRFKGGDDRTNRESFLTFIAERLASILKRNIGDAVPSITLISALIKELRGLLMIIDGLDEIAERDTNFIREIIPPLMGAGARMLCAGRPEPWVKNPMLEAGAELIFPHGLPLMSDGDIRTMILERTGPLRRLFLSRDADHGDQVKNDAIERIIKSAGGLPLYINYVIGDLLARRISIDTLGQLPPTLAAYHERLLQRGQIGDLALVNTPLLATLCLSFEPLDVEELSEILSAWGVLESDERPGKIIEQSLRAVESMIRRAPDPSGEVGFLPYHHSLRQHILASPEMRHAVARARKTFRNLAIEVGAGTRSLKLKAYMLRQGAQHLAMDGTARETVHFVTTTRGECGPLERRRNLIALNESLEKGIDLEAIDPKALFDLLVELHDGAEIAPGARALYSYHRDFLVTPAASTLLLGFAVTYELAAEIAKIERKRNDPSAIRQLQQWSSDHRCPAQYVGCYALNYLFMLESDRVPAEFLERLSGSNPYDRMVVLNALMYRALEGKSPFQWINDRPFWHSRWPYLSRDAALVKACYVYAAKLPPSSDSEVEEIRLHLEVVDQLAVELLKSHSVNSDPELIQFTREHWFSVADLCRLRELRTKLVTNQQWMGLGRLLLANPFWQVAAVGAEVLAERYQTSPADRPLIDAIITVYEPLQGAGLLGDRDLGMVDLARLTLSDDKDPGMIVTRLGPFLQSPSAHQRAQAALHITQLFHALPDQEAIVLVERLGGILAENSGETDIWALHELVEFHRAICSRGLAVPDGFRLDKSPVLQLIPGWRDLDYLPFTDAADRVWETEGVRMV